LPLTASCTYIEQTLTSQAIEAYGIFSLGEIIGRRNLVGYKLKDN
jgi:hypothetical protein